MNQSTTQAAPEKQITPMIILNTQLKGGVGKSFSTRLEYEAAVSQFGQNKVVLVDCDQANQNTIRAYFDRPNTYSINLNNEDDMTQLLNMAIEFQDKIIIVDLPGGDPKELKSIYGTSEIDTFINTFTDEGFKVKVVVPVTNDYESCNNIQGIYNIFEDKVEYHLVKNMDAQTQESTYAQSFKIFELSARGLCESLMKIDTMVQAPDPSNKNTGKVVLLGYTRNCVLLPGLDKSVKSIFSDTFNMTDSEGNKIMPPITLDNIKSVTSSPVRTALSQFYNKMTLRFKSSDLFY